MSTRALEALTFGTTGAKLKQVDNSKTITNKAHIMPGHSFKQGFIANYHQ
jgi:hypothetical protein